MNQAFIVLTNHYGDEVRINISSIRSYHQKRGDRYVAINFDNETGMAVEANIADIDKALVELYCTIKNVETSNDR